MIPNADGWEECRREHPELQPDFPDNGTGRAMRDLYDAGLLEPTGKVRPGDGGHPQRLFQLTAKGVSKEREGEDQRLIAEEEEVDRRTPPGGWN
jgi:hypothetical protein